MSLENNKMLVYYFPGYYLPELFINNFNRLVGYFYNSGVLNKVLSKGKTSVLVKRPLLIYCLLMIIALIIVKIV